LKKLSQTNSDIVRIVAEQVKRHREAAGMTQVEVADACDIYRTYLSRIEGGKANPSITVVASIATKLNVQVSALMQDFLEDEPRK
jgi:transcriptional regulator with XRE-family HTH domain